MKVYRICKEIYSQDLTGTGSKIVGGRWNFKGVSVLYTSGTVSLCTLECLAHFPPAFAPKDMALTIIEVPEDSIKELTTYDLPEDWRTVPPPKRLKDIGYHWIKRQEHLILKVPSTIVKEENNYIINPFHKDFSKVKLLETLSFEFDSRIL
ncbi:MAG: RES family NAD+ phosphorylase [Flavobacteriaceae bacterium]|nr:RES family NAD+ phosphorylase [Flavobacteriaceae bacterium]